MQKKKENLLRLTIPRWSHETDLHDQSRSSEISLHVVLSGGTIRKLANLGQIPKHLNASYSSLKLR